MKILLLTIIILIISTIIYGAKNMEDNSEKYNDVEKILDAIKTVESRGAKQLYPHPDGVSYGYYGLTESAVLDLIIYKKVSIKEKIIEALQIYSETLQKFLAYKYLELMKERYNCTWLEAAGYYHGGDAERRNKYIQKIKRNL